MKFTEKDIAYLKELGESETSIQQIMGAARMTRYTIVDDYGRKVRISAKKALELLGREKFLSGLDRSAFHWTAVQDYGDGEGLVYFDSSRYFK